MGQIGQPQREIYVEPLELPVPQREITAPAPTPTEAPAPIPQEVPVPA